MSSIASLLLLASPERSIYPVPTVPDIPGPYRVFFDSFDCQEPPHANVQRQRMVGKFWLTPVALSMNHGFSLHGADKPYLLPRRVPLRQKSRFLAKSSP